MTDARLVTWRLLVILIFLTDLNNKQPPHMMVVDKVFIFSTGLERDKFDNKTVTFEEHIKVEHNMWHYLFFIVLVKVKDSTEFTGPESYVAEMIRVRVLIFTKKNGINDLGLRETAGFVCF